MTRERWHMLLDLCLDVLERDKSIYADISIGGSERTDSIWVHETGLKAIDYVRDKSFAEYPHDGTVIYIYDPEFEEAEKHFRRLLSMAEAKT